MGRVGGALAAVAVTAAWAFSVLHADRPEWGLVAPVSLLLAFSVLRLLLWMMFAGTPEAGQPPSERAKALAMLAEARSQVAVVAIDEPLVQVRTAVLAAIAASSQTRVLLVGGDPRLAETAANLGVRFVPARRDWDAAVSAALHAATADHLVLTSASTAVVPGAALRVFEGFGEFPSDQVFVQTTVVAPADRSIIDQFDHVTVHPSIDRRRAMGWAGPASIIAVDAFRAVHSGASAPVVTARVHRRRWYGRFSPDPLVVPLSDGNCRDRRGVVAEARFRLLRSTSSPFWARRQRPAQRLAVLRAATDDIAGVAFAAAALTAVAALILGRTPVPMNGAAAAVVTGMSACTIARHLLSRGMIRPGALARCNAETMGRSLGALSRSLRATRGSPEAGRAAQAGLRGSSVPRTTVAIAVVLQLSLMIASIRLLVETGGTGDSSRAVDDLALLFVGTALSCLLLMAMRVLMHHRTLRVHRRVPISVQARIGDHRGHVVDLGADGLHLEMRAPVTMLAVVPIRLDVPGGRTVKIHAQVVRVERTRHGWLLGARLVRGAHTGAHDDYLGLWLMNAAAANLQQPKIERDPRLGRMPFRSVGSPLLRIAASAVTVVVGVAAMPGGLLALASPDAATAPPATTTTTTTTTITTTTTTTTTTTSPVASAPVPPPATEPVAAAEPVLTTTVPVTAAQAGGQPTLRVLATAGNGQEQDLASIGQPFLWQVEVSNVSSGGADGPVARGIDVIDTLPANWTYTATVATDPPRCDAAPMISQTDGVETITWTDMCDLAPGQRMAVSFNATPQMAAADVPGLRAADDQRIAHVNLVSLSADDPAGVNMGTATDTASAFVRLVDLQATLTDGSIDDDGGLTSAGFTLGSIGRYRVDVRNGGPDVAIGQITASVRLPAGFAMWTSTGAGWTCAPPTPESSGTLVGCSHPGPLAVGSSLPPVSVEVATGPDALNDVDADGNGETGLVLAALTVAGTDLDVDAANDLDEEATPIRRLADLSMIGQVSIATPFAAGARIDYVLSVSSVGPSAVNGVIVVDDPVPPGLRVVGATGRGWSCGATRFGRGFTAEPDLNGAVNCRRTVRELPAGGAIDPIFVRMQVDPLFTGAPPALGAITSSADRNPANDRTDAAADPTDPAVGRGASDLTITATDGGDAWVVGQADATIDVWITNQGPSTDPGPVVVSAAAPSGFTVSSAAGVGWSCVVSPASTADGGRDASADEGSWRCTWMGADPGADPVAAGAHPSTLTITGSVGATAVTSAAPGAANTVSHTVAVSGSGDPDVGQWATKTVVTPRAELSVVADTTGTAWIVGERATFSVQVRNEGPSPEYGPLSLTHLLPAGIEVDDIDADGWTCDLERGAAFGPSGTLVCLLGRAGLRGDQPLLAAGASAPSITVVTDVVEGAADAASAAVDGTLSLESASAVRGTTDPVIRRSTASVAIGRQTALGVAIESGATRVQVGDSLPFDVTVTNGGPSVRPGPVDVSIDVPVGLRTAEAGNDTWICAGSEPIVTCTRMAPIEVDESSTFAIGFTVQDGADAESGRASVTATIDGVEPATASALVVASDATVSDSVQSTTTTIGVPAPVVPRDDVRPELTLSTVLGAGGALGAWALALVLLLGRRRLPPL